MIERYMVDDAGTLIDMQTRDTFDYVSDVCDVLNEKDKSIKILTNHNKEYVRSINILEDKLKKLKELEKENHVLNAKVNRLTDELANCYEKLGW